jgi:probable HAF family extracellular repeat protein
MKLQMLTRFAAVALAAALVIPVHGRAQEEGEHHRDRIPHYRVVDLGTLGGAYSFAFGINSAGAVAGSSATASQSGDPAQTVPLPPQTAFLWDRGHLIKLGTLGGPNSGANGPNARGETLIISDTDEADPNGEDFCDSGTHLQCRAAIWKHGALTPLLPLAGGNNAQAYWINDRGQVIGFSETETDKNKKEKAGDCATPFQRLRFEAVIWEPDGNIRTRLQPLPGDTVAFGFGINNRGQAVGGSGSCSNTVAPPYIPSAPHAVLWEADGTPIALGDLGGGVNIAGAINNRGEVVGNGPSPDGTGHVFLWSKIAGFQDLGGFPGAGLTVAPCCNTINDRGQIAGFAVDSTGNSFAFLWQDHQWRNLNKLIPQNSHWNLQAAESINNAGEIAGTGLLDGKVRAFLAIPCHSHNGRECCELHDR